MGQIQTKDVVDTLLLSLECAPCDSAEWRAFRAGLGPVVDKIVRCRETMKAFQAKPPSTAAEFKVAVGAQLDISKHMHRLIARLLKARAAYAEHITAAMACIRRECRATHTTYMRYIRAVYEQAKTSEYGMSPTATKKDREKHAALMAIAQLWVEALKIPTAAMDARAKKNADELRRIGRALRRS